MIVHDCVSNEFSSVTIYTCRISHLFGTVIVPLKDKLNNKKRKMRKSIEKYKPNGVCDPLALLMILLHI